MRDRVYKFVGTLAVILYTIIILKDVEGSKNFLELIKVLIKNMIVIGAGCFAFAIGDKN